MRRLSLFAGVLLVTMPLAAAANDAAPAAAPASSAVPAVAAPLDPARAEREPHARRAQDVASVAEHELDARQHFDCAAVRHGAHLLQHLHVAQSHAFDLAHQRTDFVLPRGLEALRQVALRHQGDDRISQRLLGLWPAGGIEGQRPVEAPGDQRGRRERDEAD